MRCINAQELHLILMGVAKCPTKSHFKKRPIFQWNDVAEKTTTDILITGTKYDTQHKVQKL